MKNRDNMDSKCQTSPIVRGEKEGQRSHGRVGIKSRGSGSQISHFEVNGNKKGGIEAVFKLKTEIFGEPKESLVQMRIRLLEQSHKSQQKHQPSIQRKKKVVRPEGSEDELTNTPMGINTDESRSSSKQRDGAGLHKPHPRLAPRPSKSLGLLKSATNNSATSVTSPKGSLEMHAPCSAKQKLETTAGSGSKAERELIESPAFKVPFYRFGTRNRNEASLKSLAPIIRERVKMFESTRDGENVGSAALDGPSAWPTGRKSKVTHKPGVAMFEGVKELMGEKHAKFGWPSPATNHLNETMSAFSQFLAERKRSRTGCMVDGKYVSAFAYRRKTKETSTSTSWATATASRESESASLNSSLIIRESPKIGRAHL